MVKLNCSFSGKTGSGDGATMDSVPLISPLDVSQLQPAFSDQVVIKTQTEYQLSSGDQPTKFSDLEAQKLGGGHPEDARSRHKICTPLTLEMYYTELDPEHHRSLLAAIGAYPVGRKHGTETPWLSASYHAFKEAPKAHKAPARAAMAAVTEPSRKPSGKPSGEASAPGEKEAAQKVEGSAPPPAPQ
ncbi:neuron-specific vesicular protein calcyon isoform X2 [Sagmatias obliquidens]|uniref:neuron-specific vesicular protein calcyon isoform X2 n=1 Tax=Sagmatias obliquidens TaxID=3371155 RepID=UPI000F44412A|nr:neuron-specific vesicular protein calcyon isoform X2 [Lagenorhynchus obliquidens]